MRREWHEFRVLVGQLDQQTGVLSRNFAPRVKILRLPLEPQRGDRIAVPCIETTVPVVVLEREMKADHGEQEDQVTPAVITWCRQRHWNEICESWDLSE